MKKIIFGVGFVLLMLVVFFLPVGKEKEPSKQVKIVNTTETTDFLLSESYSKAFSEERTRDTVSETTESSIKEMQVNNKELLQSFGEAYANYSNINDRNEKLKKLMTAECIKKNGIDVKTAVQLSSEGNVETIYQSEDNKYAIVLTCKQSDRVIRVLLLASVKDGKISEMTYNTIKQEY
ncbi:EF0163 family protein [Enterococcus faecalis]|uniref:EF0163 family protein n=1 Tax=Enterococcus faecalis TaxID=1351 RepID=UPI001F576180|nr:EF0163 family protein [Enterococcus faecalis]